MRSTGEGNGKPLQYSCLDNPMNSMKRQNDRISKEELQGRATLPFPSPVDLIFSELSTMTCLSWEAVHGVAHSFIELDKAVVHVIRLVTFL